MKWWSTVFKYLLGWLGEIVGPYVSPVYIHTWPYPTSVWLNSIKFYPKKKGGGGRINFCYIWSRSLSIIKIVDVISKILRWELWFVPKSWNMGITSPRAPDLCGRQGLLRLPIPPKSESSAQTLVLCAIVCG